jgi:hypothetical protein
MKRKTRKPLKVQISDIEQQIKRTQESVDREALYQRLEHLRKLLNKKTYE